MREIKISQNCKAADTKIIDLGFPKNAIIAMIKRNEKFLTPKGSTVIHAGDTLVVLSEDEEGLDDVIKCVN